MCPLAGMVVSFTIRCDWSGCNATAEVLNRADTSWHGLRVEQPGLNSLHLCPEYFGKTWPNVRENLDTIEAHSTPRITE